MIDLQPNIHHFPDSLNCGHTVLTESVCQGKLPEILIIKCSLFNEDPAPLQTFVRTGRSYCLQTMGNLVPTYDNETGLSEKATLEQAVVLNQVEHIIVCGHLPCRIMKELVEQSVVEQAKLHIVPPIWHNFAMVTVNLLRTHYKDFTKESLYTIATQENILVQIDHLLTYPFIQNKIKAKKLWIHGWLQINDEEKTLFNYDFSSRNFILLEQNKFDNDGKLTYLPKQY